MGFMFVLVLATLAAYTQATLSYGSGQTYGRGSFGLGSGLGGGRLIGGLGRGGRLGQLGCFPRCGYGEVCVGGGLKGRPYCQRDSPFLGGGSPVLGGSRIGGRRNVCYDYAYPNDCVSTSKFSSISRYAFRDGYCQEFSCDIGNHCRPQGHINNIFTSIRECQQYCRD